MNNILCASTVFSNVIILYLYFSNSNSVLIVLYVCSGVRLRGASTNSPGHQTAAVLRWNLVEGGVRGNALTSP